MMGQEEANKLLAWGLGMIACLLLLWWKAREHENRTGWKPKPRIVNCPCCTSKLRQGLNYCPECFVDLEGR